MRLHYLASAVLLLAAITGCEQGSDGGGGATTSGGAGALGEKPAAPSGEMDETQAETFVASQGPKVADDALKSAEGGFAVEQAKGMGSFDSPTLTERANFATVEVDKCEPTLVQGDTTDADSDEIYELLEQTFACSGAAEGNSYSVSGGILMDDADDNDSHSGFEIEIKEYSLTASGSQNGQSGSISIMMDGFFKTAITDELISTEVKFGTSYNIVSAGTTIAATSAQYLDIDYAPKDDGNHEPYDKGTLNIAEGGMITVSVSGASDEAAAALNFSLGVSAVDLLRDTCTSGFDSGVITFTDGGGNVIEGTYANCSASWTYNGDVI